MDGGLTAITIAWVLACLGAVAVFAPAAMLDPSAGRAGWVANAGPALVWTWLTMAVLVPLASAMHGFNWATALLIAMASPVARWCYSCRGERRAAFRQLVRSIVFRALKPRSRFAAPLQRRTLAILGIALTIVCAMVAVAGPVDVRLPVPADFDTFWRTRQLLEGTPTWDPLAALVAVMTRISAAGSLLTLNAIRLALVSLTATAAGVLVAQRHGRAPHGAMAAVGIVAATPWAPASAWAVVLLLLIAALAFLHRVRDGSSRHAWHAAGALALAIAHVVPFSGHPAVLWSVTAAPRYLEHASAARQALRLARLSRDDNWMLIGLPEQRLEIDGRGRFYDLARFVSVFRHRTADAEFRFGLGVPRLFVIVEKEPADVSLAVPGVQFVAAQPAVYRVPRERARLARAAQQMCDEYRRTHGGVTVVYDDAVLRVYRIDV